MRVDRLRIPALGGLRGLDTGPDPLPDLVVVTGPNEAGKSTVLEAIRTVLYGIYPARREAHPLVPWDGTEASILADLRTASGDVLSVHRRILATPWGRLEEGGRERDLRNHHLPGLTHVSREVYEQVHAIALPEITELQEGEAWTMIRDRILAGMGTRDLGSPRAVAESLDAAAGALWRSRQQGNFRDRVLAGEIEALGAKLREARQADRELRVARDTLAQEARELEELRRERAALTELERQATHLLPLAARLRHLDALAAAAGAANELGALPRSPRERREELVKAEDEARGEAEAAAERLARMGESMVELKPGDERLLAAAVEIEQAAAVARGGDEARERLLEQRTRVERVRDELLEFTTPLAADPEAWLDPERRGPLVESLRGLPVDELRASLVRRGQASTRALEVEERLEMLRAQPAPPPPRARPPSTVWILMGMGAILVAAGILVIWARGASSALAPVVMLAGLGLGSLGFYLRRDDARLRDAHRQRLRERTSEEEGLVARLAEHRRAEEGARQEIRTLIGELGLRENRLDGVGDTLASSLETLRTRLRELELAEKELEAESRRVGEARHRVQALAWRLDLGPAPGRGDAGAGDRPADPPPSVELAPLQGGLREARRREEARAAAVLEREEREEALREARGRLERARGLREALDERLLSVAPASGASAPEALEVAERRLEAHRRHAALVEELEAAHGPLAELRQAVEAARVRWGGAMETDGPGGSSPDGEGADASEGLAATRARLEGLSERIDELQARVTRNRTILERTGEVDTPDLLESELERLREAREEARRERDRLWLLARLTRVAERRFREAHQPELVRGAEAILARITRGRYDTLLLGDDQEPDALQVRGRHLPSTRPVTPPLSTGIREQIWFSLRMAVVGLVEGAGEPLPLVLDEVFVNWDARRRHAALDALADLARERQIFLVTCHPWLAAEAVARGAGLVDLTPGPPSPQLVMEPLA